MTTCSCPTSLICPVHTYKPDPSEEVTRPHIPRPVRPIGGGFDFTGAGRNEEYDYCRHCKRHLEEHAHDGKCLFGPQHFKTGLALLNVDGPKGRLVTVWANGDVTAFGPMDEAAKMFWNYVVFDPANVGARERRFYENRIKKLEEELQCLKRKHSSPAASSSSPTPPTNR